MSVRIETTLGDFTVDLYLDQRPVTCLNFLKLCKMKYYNFNLFHSIRSGFIAQTGDPTGKGSGGESIWGILEGPQKRFFSGEKLPKIHHTDAGLLSMVCSEDMMVGSQFFFTLAPDLDSLDDTHCVIGEVTEGREVLSKLNEVICDELHRPYRDVRITHTIILEDPFNDPPGLRAPSRSPSPNSERLKGGRIAPDEEIDETQGKTTAEIQELIEEKEARARATILEIVGDLPDANIAPPENVLFVCKLNPVTTDDDLEIIFSRFGKIVSCEVIRDKTTGNSLQYAFIEFDDKKSCEDAYFKMDNVLIDDRRIHVDFSQSVSKMRWLGKGRGVQYYDNNGKEQRFKNQHTDRKPNKPNEDNNIKRVHGSERDQKVRYDQNYRYKDKRYESDKNSKPEKRYRSNSRERVRNGEDSKHINSQNSESSRRVHSTDDRHRPTSSVHRSQSFTRKYKESSSQKNVQKEKYTSNDRNRSKNEHHSYESKHKKEDKNSLKESTKIKKRKLSHNNVEPKTPPVKKSKVLNNKTTTQRDNDKTRQNKKARKHVSTKRKRKASTSSSDSDSSDSSSSSSDSSSSSGTDRKKKKVNTKKRKMSSSSSSSSDTSTSSSSSSESSSTSSTSSDSEPRRKGKKYK